MRITMIGTGYVGLVSGICFSEAGNDVTCVDVDQDKVDKLNNGTIPIYEPGLEHLYERNRERGGLTFTTQFHEGVKPAEVIFMALPTPPGNDGSADLSYVLDVAEKIGPMLTDYTVIVDKSTVPVGTADKVRNKIAGTTDVPFDVISNPEFLREGKAVEDFMKPDRVVIGTQSERAREVMDELYEPFVRQGNPLIFMDERSAEMTKYAANAYLATRITFMNEIANLCEKIGANVDDVRKGMGSDARIGKRFLFPGIGYGGSCFPKDVQALAKTAGDEQYDFRILNSVMEVNHRQKHLLVEKIKEHYGSDLSDQTFAIWGLAFKADTDDIREAPSIHVIEELLQSGATIRAYDPEAMANIDKLFDGKIDLIDDMYNVLEGADALLVLTEWNLFRSPEFSIMEQKLEKKVIFDGRNLYSLEHMQDTGFYYNSIGRKAIQPKGSSLPNHQ